MALYTQQIEEQIARRLGRSGQASPDDLAGLSREEAIQFLRQYASLHTGTVTFDAALGCLAPVAASNARPPSSQQLSPVDQILAAPVGKSALDVKASGGAYPKWTWFMTLTFGLPGGLIAWFVVREDNAQAARAMLITGAFLQLVGVALTLSLR